VYNFSHEGQSLFIRALHFYADIAVVHLELLSDRTLSPYLIVPDRVWKRRVSLSVVPYECVVFYIPNILLYVSEILFNILEKDTVAVYVFAVSTPNFCRGFLFSPSEMELQPVTNTWI